MGATPLPAATRRLTGDRALLDALAALNGALRDVGAPSMIIGGIAVIARGVARATRDIDATVWGQDVEVDALFDVFGRHGIEGRIPDAVAFARRRHVLLLRHAASGTPLDVSLAWLPFEAEALARASDVDFGGVLVRVALPEDLVVLKAVAWRDQDRSDVERLLVRYADSIDIARVRRVVAEFAAVLEAPERVGELEAVIRRARNPE